LILLKNKLLKNIGLLVGGTAVAQVITFIATIYLTRIYSPESFGLLSLATSLVSLLVPLSTMRYDKAIVLAEDKKETNSLFFLSSSINALFFVLLLVIGIIIWSCDLINEEHSLLVFLVPVGVFLFGFSNIFQMFYEKQSKFKVTSSVALIDASTKAGLQYMLFSSFPKIGMVIGYIGALIANLFYYIVNAKSLFGIKWLGIGKEDLKSTAKKYNKFPKYFTWSNIIDSASQNVCALTFPFLFSLQILGNFSIAYKIVRLPALIIAMATRRTYYPKASELYTKNPKQFINLYKKSSLVLVGISILPVLIFEMYAEELFELLFDPSWMSSALYAKIILGYVFVNFCNSLAHENMIIFGLQKNFLIIEVVWFLLSLSLIYVAFLYDQSFLAVVFYAIGGIIMEFLVFITQFKKGIYNSTNKASIENGYN